MNSADEADTAKKRRKARKQRVRSISTFAPIIIAACALLLTLDQSIKNQKLNEAAQEHNRLSVKPVLEIFLYIKGGRPI